MLYEQNESKIMTSIEEEEFLKIMDKFPLGYDEDKLIVGKWFKDKDLLDSVKNLYSLRDKIKEKK